MKTIIQNKKLFSIILAVLMAGTIVMQFLPFWNNGETTCSIQRMLWFPDDQPEIQSYIESMSGSPFNIDSVVWLTLGTMICSVLGFCFSLFKPNTLLPSIFSTCSGFFGVWNYLSRPVLRLGSLWGIHLAVSILMLILGTFCLISQLILSHEAE